MRTRGNGCLLGLLLVSACRQEPFLPLCGDGEQRAGDVCFLTPQFLATGNQPFAAALGDLDGDLDLDLVVTNSGDDTVTVFFNAGDGQLTGPGKIGLPLSLPTGDFPVSVALGDINGDLDLDLLVGNSGSDDINVFENPGDGLLLPQTTFPGFGRRIALGDIDGDGDLDLVIPGSVFLNPGDGQFTAPPQIGFSAAEGSLALGDLDGDGDLDGVVAEALAPFLDMFVNEGSGVLRPVLRGMDSSSADILRDLALGDLDGDGDLDMALVAQGNSDEDGRSFVRILWNLGGRVFEEEEEDDLGGGTAPEAVALGDLDGDDDLDVAVTGGGALLVRLHREERQFGPSFAFLAISAGNSSRDVVLGDLNGDAALDAVVIGESDSVGVLLADP